MFPDDRQAGGYRTPALIFLLLLTVRCSSAQSPSNNNNDNPYFASTNFNPSMAIVIVVLISAFFFLGFFSIYIRQCAGDRLAPSSVRPSAAARSRQQRGLDADVLATFPTLVYSEVKHLKIGKGSLECAVCLSEFDDDETLRLLPKCSHVFHADCIDAWLAAHVTCPVCRSNLVPDPNAPDSPLDPLPPPTQPSTDPQNPEPTPPSDHLAVEIDEGDEERKAEIENLERFVNMKRARSRARPANFPRSHSTGHSLIQPGEDLDRFTLRLPEDIRQGIVAASRMQRARSLAAFPMEESTRRGFRGEGSTGRAGRSIRLGRSDRWGSFLMRTLSVKNWGRRNGEGGSSRGGFFRRGEPSPGSVKGEGSSVKGVRFNPVITPLGGSVSGKGNSSLDESSTAALNKV